MSEHTHTSCANPIRCNCGCAACMSNDALFLPHDEAEALVTGNPLDAACAELAAFSRAHGAGGFELDVRADGRVWIRRLDASGRPCGIAAADLVPGSSLPLPSAALAGMVRT